MVMVQDANFHIKNLYSKNSSCHDPNNNVNVNNFLEEMKNV